MGGFTVMATMRDYLLAKTTLPVVGTHTYKEHFLSFISNVTAELGGSIEVELDADTINIEQKTVQFAIDITEASTEIATTPTATVIDNTKEVYIVIDPTC